MPKTYEPIATTTLGSSSGTVEFTSISSAYTDLILVANFSVTNNGSTFYYQVGNGSVDTGSNYSSTNLYSGGISGTTAISDRSSSATSVSISASMGFSNTGISNYAIFNFQNYSNTTTYKTVLVRAGNGGGNSYSGGGAFCGLWRSTSAITNIKLTGASTSFASGSIFTIYGIKAA
jgi:hypothetical protein